MACDAALVADTVVLVTVCSGLPELFTEKQRAPPPRAPRAPKGQKDEQHLKVLRESDPAASEASAERAEELASVLRNRGYAAI